TASAFAIAPPIDLAIGERLALVFNAPVICALSNVTATDTAYPAGDAYVDAGAGWVPLSTTDGKYDIAVRTLIHPAASVGYLSPGHGAGLPATLLNTGKVLIVGPGTVAEVYDPTAKTSTPTAGPQNGQRFHHTATLLDDGTVLVAGGRDFSGTTFATA